MQYIIKNNKLHIFATHTYGVQGNISQNAQSYWEINLTRSGWCRLDTDIEHISLRWWTDGKTTTLVNNPAQEVLTIDMGDNTFQVQPLHHAMSK